MQLYVINPDPFLSDLISSDSLLTSLSSTTTILSVYVELYDITLTLKINSRAYLKDFRQTAVVYRGNELLQRQSDCACHHCCLQNVLQSKMKAKRNWRVALKAVHPHRQKPQKWTRKWSCLHNACILGGQGMWLMPYTERFWNLINMPFKRCYIIQWK